MNRAQEKAQRLLHIEKLLWAHPEGLTRAEIARRIGVNRSTITKYLDADQLPPGIYEAEDGSKKLLMDRNADLTKTSFSLHEVLAIHLATRLLATRTDKQNPHAASALRKLGLALQRLDQNVSHHLLRSADMMDEDADFRDPVYLKVLETLTEAWSAGRKVRLSHQMEDGRIFEYIFSPYFIEPYAVGQTAHVIGWRELPGKEGQGARRTFKIERIRSAEITRESYTIPADFDPRALLSDAWGIWYTEKEPVEVVLRFHPSVAMRVKESRWHHSQQVEEQPDGSLLWRARIAEPQEMVPWVRGWGADCEVVGPRELRDKIAEEAQRLAWVYNLHLNNSAQDKGGDPMDIFQQFVTLPGKTEPRLTIFEHSSDVFHVALYLLSHNQASVRHPHLIKAGALLHDVGKIAQDVQVGKQWNHQPHSAEYLQPLVEHPRMKALLGDNEVAVDQVKYADLLLICEHHHDLPTQPALLRRCPEALLVSVADVMASSLESGWLGDIRTMLTTNTYTNLNLALLENLGLDGGLDGEIHRIDLPGDSVADALLNDLIFRDMSKRITGMGLEPVLQKGGSFWIAGDSQRLRTFLEDYTVNPHTLYESAELADEIYDGVLAAMPAPGSVQMDTIKYLLVNEQIARKVMLGLVDRRRVRQALEHFDISPHQVHETFGVRGRTVLNKLEAIGESPRYLMTGAQAAYHYHRWRTASAGDYELLISPEDFDTWYSYLRDSHIFAGKVLPTQTERKRYLEVMILVPELNEELWRNRVLVEDIAYIAPMDLLFRLVTAQT